MSRFHRRKWQIVSQKAEAPIIELLQKKGPNG